MVREYLADLEQQNPVEEPAPQQEQASTKDSTAAWTQCWDISAVTPRNNSLPPRNKPDSSGEDSEVNRPDVPAWWLNGKLMKRRTFGMGQIRLLKALTSLFRLIIHGFCFRHFPLSRYFENGIVGTICLRSTQKQPRNRAEINHLGASNATMFRLDMNAERR